jgi:hypothetical protein
MKNYKYAHTIKLTITSQLSKYGNFHPNINKPAK